MRRSLRGRDRRSLGRGLGFIYAVVGTIRAVLLAFVVTFVWERTLIRLYAEAVIGNAWAAMARWWRSGRCSAFWVPPSLPPSVALVPVRELLRETA